MANVVLLNPLSIVDRLPPGTPRTWGIGPADLYKYAAITVTAHGYEPLVEDTQMSVDEVTVQERSVGDVIIWVTVRNTGASTIRSFYLYICTIGR
jgi:hypothetical protein